MHEIERRERRCMRYGRRREERREEQERSLRGRRTRHTSGQQECRTQPRHRLHAQRVSSKLRTKPARQQ